MNERFFERYTACDSSDALLSAQNELLAELQTKTSDGAEEDLFATDRLDSFNPNRGVGRAPPSLPSESESDGDADEKPSAGARAAASADAASSFSGEQFSSAPSHRLQPEGVAQRARGAPVGFGFEEESVEQ